MYLVTTMYPTWFVYFIYMHIISLKVDSNFTEYLIIEYPEIQRTLK